PDTYSNDASLLIPATALDASYIVLGWPGAGGVGSPYLDGDARSYVTIVGTRANTHVRVIPSTYVGAGDGVPALGPGMPLVVTLGEFETLNLEGADFVPNGPTDFSDTFGLMRGHVPQSSSVSAFTLSASAPVRLGQFLGGADTSMTGEGDPSFIMVPPVVQYRTRYIFLVPSGYDANWILLSMPRGV